MMALEIFEEGAIGLSHDVDEHIEPSPVRHADHHASRAIGRAACDGFIEERHKGVHPFDREPLHAHIGPSNEALEPVDRGEALQQLPLLLDGKRHARLSRLDGMPEPFAFGLVAEMLDFVAEAPAVDLTQVSDVVRGVAAVVGAERCRRNRGQLFLGDAVEFRVQLRGTLRGGAEGIDLDREMSKFADGRDQRARAGSCTWRDARCDSRGGPPLPAPPLRRSAKRKNWRHDSSTEFGSRR